VGGTTLLGSLSLLAFGVRTIFQMRRRGCSSEYANILEKLNMHAYIYIDMISSKYAHTLERSHT